MSVSACVCTKDDYLIELHLSAEAGSISNDAHILEFLILEQFSFLFKERQDSLPQGLLQERFSLLSL